MRRVNGILAALAIAALAASAAGDNVQVGALAYNNVAVRDVSGGTITFVMQTTGVKVIKRFSDVRRIEVVGDVRFTRAEKDFADGDFETALDGYRQTVTGALKPWMKTVAEVRLITCHQHAAQLGKAVALYFKLFKISPAMVAGVALDRIGPAGSAGNKDALAKLTALAGSEQGAVLEKVNEVLTAVRAVERPGATVTPGDDDDDEPTLTDPQPTGPAPTAGDVKRQLSRIASLLAQGKGSEALAAIDTLRKGGAPTDAATAGELYFQEGMARKLRAAVLRRDARTERRGGDEPKAKRLEAQATAEFRRAGYCLLRLPLTRAMASLPKAPRALHEVGLLYRDDLSNTQMARKCFQKVRGQYATSPWSRASGDALRTLD